MIYAILTIVALVGIIGWQWVEIQCLRQELDDTKYENYELSAELDPVELYNLRCIVDAEVEDA